MKGVYENKLVYIELEDAEIPWFKIFSHQEVKELTDCTSETQQEIFRLLLILEKAMLAYFKPDKINIASFANYLPQVHWHIMARYEKDSYFPESMWGVKQREADLEFPSINAFVKKLPSLLD